MRKLLVFLLAVAFFNAKAGFAQVVDAPPGVTPGAGSFSYIQHSSFAYSFEQTSTGYQAKTYFTSDPGGTIELAVSLWVLDKDGNVLYSDTQQYIPAQAWYIPAVIDLPGFDWSNCGHVILEWSAWHRNEFGQYDDIFDDVAYEYHL